MLWLGSFSRTKADQARMWWRRDDGMACVTLCIKSSYWRKWANPTSLAHVFHTNDQMTRSKSIAFVQGLSSFSLLLVTLRMMQPTLTSAVHLDQIILIASILYAYVVRESSQVPYLMFVIILVYFLLSCIYIPYSPWLYKNLLISLCNGRVSSWNMYVKKPDNYTEDPDSIHINRSFPRSNRTPPSIYGFTAVTIICMRHLSTVFTRLGMSLRFLPMVFRNLIVIRRSKKYTIESTSVDYMSAAWCCD